MPESPNYSSQSFQNCHRASPEMHLSAFLHFIAPCFFLPPSFNECCFALCSTSRLQFGIWDSGLDSKTVVTQCLLLIKPRRMAKWVQAWWVQQCLESMNVVVFLNVLVMEVN